MMQNLEKLKQSGDLVQKLLAILLKHWLILRLVRESIQQYPVTA